MTSIMDRSCKAVCMAILFTTSCAFAIPPPISPQPVWEPPVNRDPLAERKHIQAMLGMFVRRIATANNKSIEAVIDAWPRDGELSMPYQRGAFEVVDGVGGTVWPGQLELGRVRLSLHPDSAARVVNVELQGSCVTESELQTQFGDMGRGMPHPTIDYTTSQVEGSKLTFAFETKGGCLRSILFESVGRR